MPPGDTGKYLFFQNQEMAYFGGKAQDGVYQAIINQIPEHDRYIEPFLGGGAIMLRKRPALINIGLDMCDQAISNFPDRENTEIFKGNALDYLANIPFYQGRTFIYCDPPYLHSTRGKARYRFEMSDDDHDRLLRYLKALDCFVAISTYPNSIYSGELKYWRSISYESVKRSGAIGRELLYMNYDPPGILHDDQYIGDNANNRQDIKRRISRTKKRIITWNSRERIKLMRELIEKLPGHEKEHLSKLLISDPA